MIPCPRCARGLSPASSVCDRCGVPVSMEFTFSPTFPKPEFFLAELEYNTQAELEKTHQYSLDELKSLAAKMASLEEEEERSREEEKKKKSAVEEYLPLDDKKDSSYEEMDTATYDGSDDDETTPCLTVEGLESENFEEEDIDESDLDKEEDIDESDLDDEEDIDESDLDEEEDIDESDLDDDVSDYHEIDEYDEYDDEDDGFDIDDDFEKDLEYKTDSKDEFGAKDNFEQEITDSRFYESDDGEFEEDCFSDEDALKADLLEGSELKNESSDDDSYVGLDDKDSSSNKISPFSKLPSVRKLGPLDSLAPQILIQKPSSSSSEKADLFAKKTLSSEQVLEQATVLKEEESSIEKEVPHSLEKKENAEVSLEKEEEAKSSDSSDDLEMERVTEYPEQWEWMVFADEEKMGEEGYQVMGKVEERQGDNLVFPHAQKDNPSLVEEINESDRDLIQKLIEEKKIVEAIRLVRRSSHGLSFPHGKDILQLLAKESNWKLAKKCPTVVDKLSPKMRQEIILMLKEGKTLEACYLLRKSSQLSLTQSREHVEAFCFEQAIDYYPTEIHRPTTRKFRSQIYKKKKISSIFWLILLIILLACAGYFLISQRF